MQCSERSEGVHGTVGEVRGEERALEYDDGRVLPNNLESGDGAGNALRASCQQQNRS